MGDLSRTSRALVCNPARVCDRRLPQLLRGALRHCGYCLSPYATPTASVVRSWNAKTPEGFLLAAKKTL